MEIKDKAATSSKRRSPSNFKEVRSKLTLHEAEMIEALFL
jgi:hypothetical protein